MNIINEMITKGMCEMRLRDPGQLTSDLAGGVGGIFSMTLGPPIFRTHSWRPCVQTGTLLCQCMNAATFLERS